MQEFILSFGMLAPLIFLILVSIGPIFFISMSFLAFIAGAMFGFKVGLILIIVGAIFNNYIMFLMTRTFLKGYVEKILEKRLSKKKRDSIMAIDDEKLMISMFIFRLIPIIPYSLINYAFGLTNISFRKYMLAGVLGTLPGKLIYLNVGAHSTDIMSIDFLIAAILLLLLLVVSYVLSKKYK